MLSKLHSLFNDLFFSQQVTRCFPGQSDIHIFQTQEVDDKCITDVVIQARNEGMKTDLCLSAG